MATDAAATAGAEQHQRESREGRGGHDWHSTEYVREWVRENEARVDQRRPQFDLLASFIPHPREQTIRILDIGAGWGPVTRHLLSVFPAASAVLFDYSDVMFEEARRALTGSVERIRFAKGDLAQPGALSAALAGSSQPFDAVVSSSCIHNVRPTERIPALYREVRDVTAAGGCFLNLDMVGAASPLLQEVWQRARIERLRRRRQDETGALPPVDAILAELQAERPAHHGPRDAPGSAEADAPVSHAGRTAVPPQARGREPDAQTSGGSRRSLHEHLTWLQQAGFDAVECFWREGNRALIGGYTAS